MFSYNLKTALPFYKNINYQNRFTKPSSEAHAAIAAQNDLPPFIFIVTGSSPSAVISDVLVKKLDDSLVYQLSAPEISTVHQDKIVGSNSWYIWFVSGLTLSLPAGTCYIEVVFDGDSYFSEIFEVRCFNTSDTVQKYLRFEWDNDGCDLPPILYHTGFVDSMFLDSTIAQEEPVIEEEGQSDGYNDFYPTFQKYVSNYSTEALVPFFQAEALILMSMHKRVKIYVPSDPTYIQEIRNIIASASQVDNSALYLVKLNFKIDTQYVNNACCTNISVDVLCAILVKNVFTESISVGLPKTYKVSFVFEGGTPVDEDIEVSTDLGVTWVNPVTSSNIDPNNIVYGFGNSVTQQHYVRIRASCSPGSNGSWSQFYYSTDYSHTFSAGSITTNSFIILTGFSPGVTWDLSLDGGVTYIQTGLTSSSYTVSGLTSGTTYPVVRRMHSINGIVQELPAVNVTTL